MKQDTNHRVTKFISSQQMENSEIQKRIINLGKTLVEELKLDPGVDTLSRWMAHYIAKQIVNVENAKGRNKATIEQKCFEKILELWAHRSVLPTGQRPFENFESIFNTLEKLDPNNKMPFYFRGFDEKNDNDKNKIKKEVQNWLNVALAIDQAVRVWLKYVFVEAAKSAKDKKNTKWLKNLANFEDDYDTKIINKLLFEEINDATKIEQEKLQQIQEYIENLKAFRQFNNEMISDLEKKLENIIENICE